MTTSMRPLSILGIVISMIVWVNVSITQSLPFPQQAPKGVIEELWGMAVRGGLLTPKGWNRAGDYFTDPTPWTTNMTVVVMSNDYGFDESSISGGTAKALMMCSELGKIDANLRYTPLPPKQSFKSGRGYDLVAVPAHTLVFVPGTKKPEEKVNTNVTYWKVKESKALLATRGLLSTPRFVTYWKCVRKPPTPPLRKTPIKP